LTVHPAVKTRDGNYDPARGSSRELQLAILNRRAGSALPIRDRATQHAGEPRRRSRRAAGTSRIGTWHERAWRMTKQTMRIDPTIEDKIKP
jgi:hypothetical protein